MRTDLKITMKDSRGVETDRTLSYVNPQISNSVAESLATMYANMSTSIYVGAQRIISMDVSEPYEPTQKEANNNG